MQAARPSPSPPKPWERNGGATAAVAAPAPLPSTTQSSATQSSTAAASTALSAAPAIPARPASMSTDASAYGSQAGAVSPLYTSRSPHHQGALAVENNLKTSYESLVDNSGWSNVEEKCHSNGMEGGRLSADRERRSLVMNKDADPLLLYPLQYGSRYGATTSPYGATTSPYSRLGGYGSYGSAYGSGYGSGYGGLGGYGSSYGMGGYGSSYGMGMGGYGMGGYGMGGMGMPGMGGVGPEGMQSLSQRMEAGTAATFQVIQSIVGAFGGFAQMLESTFMATHSSFFAMIGVAEQFGHLRNYLGQVLSIFALIRWCRGLLDKVLGRETATEAITAEGFRAFEAGGQAAAAGANGKSDAPKLAKKPLIVFLLTVIGLPYLMTRLVRLITARQEEEARRLAAMPYDPNAPLLDNYGRPLPPNMQPQPQPLDPNQLTFVRALYPYESTDSQELSLAKDEIVAVLTPKSEREASTPGWWKGRLRNGTVGWFPSTHVAELPLNKAKEVPA